MTWQEQNLMHPDAIYDETFSRMLRPFEAYTWQHWGALLVFLCCVLLVLYAANHIKAERKRILFGTGLAVVTWGVMVVGSFSRLLAGTYDMQSDLPLYLCRLIAWILPFAAFFRWRTVLGIFYFWILAGTLQALFTPDLAEGFPSYWYFRYWFLHCGLVITILYLVKAYRIRIRWRDFWYALAASQVYLAGVHVLNWLLGSNYTYTMRKPPNASLLDLMGPWPWYILAGEGLMILLFLFFMLPFIRPLPDKSH